MVPKQVPTSSRDPTLMLVMVTETVSHRVGTSGVLPNCELMTARSRWALLWKCVLLIVAQGRKYGGNELDVTDCLVKALKIALPQGKKKGSC